MKITIVADVLGQENNGTTATIKRMMMGLVERGHQVTMVSPHKDDQSTNPKYITVKQRNFGIFNKYMAKNGVELGRPEKDKILEAITGADVVHIELPFKMGKLAAKLCRQLDIPYTTAFHCQPENVTSHIGLKDAYLINKCLYFHFKNNFYKKVKYIHCPTAFIANELNKNNYKAQKFVISNGVIDTYTKMDVEKPKELKDKFVVLNIGRFVNEKRQDILIKAMKYSKYADKIQLIFAGVGPKLEKIKKMSKSLKNPPIFGYYPKEELAKIVNYSDLYVHPSDVEIEAIVCLEAMICGLVPVISDSKKSASRFFALADRSLFKAGDPKDCAKKIDYMIEHPEEKAELSEKYVEAAQIYKFDNTLSQMIEMFEIAIKDKEKEREERKQEVK